MRRHRAPGRPRPSFRRGERRWRRRSAPTRCSWRSLPCRRGGRAEMWLVLEDRAGATALSREQQFADQLRRRYPELKFRDASPLLHAMREIKSAAEIALIQRAVDITSEAQKAAMARVLTATSENQVQATIEFT